MKAKFFTLILVMIVSFAFGQNQFRELLRDSRGISKEFISIESFEQIPYKPSNPREFFNLDASSDLVLLQTEPDQLGFIHYRYYQTYRGIPVENTMFIVHTKNDLLTGMSGAIVVDFDQRRMSTVAPAIPEKSAIQSAIEYVSASRFAWEDEQMEQRIKEETGLVTATHYPVADLVWYCTEQRIDPRNFRLAYKVDVYAKEPVSRAFYFIDARDGKILGKEDLIHHTDAVGTANTAYSGTQTIHSDLFNGSYRLRDLTKGSGVITKHGDLSGDPDYTSSSANWNLTGTNQAAMDVHYGVSSAYDFYLTNFNRNSVNNSGLALTSYVNENNTTDNAYWDGSSMHFGTRSNGANGGVTGIDVVAHEMTHGVTQYTCDLNYSYESGAMNESMSDILGKCVQFWAKPTDINWKLSNDMNWLIRDMQNPNTYSDPDTYQGTYWATGSGDNGGVHTNSGVGNFMFYLLVTGGSGTNDIGNAYTVSGIGLSDAQQIIYRTQTVYLVSTSNYSAWRTACINAATDLFGATSNQLTQVQNAWYAVGIGTPGGGGGTCLTPTGLNATSVTSSSATLNWSTVGGATSYNVRYKPTSSGAWTNTTSTSTSKSVTGLTSSTPYEFQVQTVCSGGNTSSYSSSANFATTSGGGGVYCASNGTDQSYEYIDYVSIGSITRSSGSDGGYYNGSGSSTNVTQGSNYTLTFSAGFTGNTYPESWAFYIDWNNDGDFTDSGETEATASSSGSGNNTVTISVPSTATVAVTRMRVSMQYDASPPACGTYTFGEVEDYSLNVQASGGGSCSETHEPNNFKSAAAPISVNTDLLSQISTSSDNDWFSFANTSTNKNIKVTLTTVPFDYDIKLYNPGGSLIATSENSNTSNETIIYNTSTVGTYKVRVYGWNGANSNTLCYTLRASIASTPFKLSEDNLKAEGEDIVLYPVPATNTIVVNYNSSQSGTMPLSIYNGVGEQVFSQSQDITDGENHIQLDISSLSNGIYFLEIRGDAGLARKQFVVTR